MKNCLFIFSSILFISLITTAESKNLTLTGSSTVAPIMLDISQAFEKKFPEMSVEIQTGGSTRGIIDVRRGLSQIGMVSRDLNKSEADLVQVPIAIDGLGVIVHKDNLVNGLSKKQLTDIYTGKILNWKDLGGADQKITVVHKSEGRSTLDLFLKYTGLKNSKIRPHLIIGDNEQGIKNVIGNKSAIAYVSVGSASFNTQAGEPIKLLALDGVKASKKHIMDKTYPVLRTLNLVYKGELTLQSKKLLSFSKGAEVNGILNKHYVLRP